MAQRMSVLYGLNSPEFFDKSLFRNFIDLLRRRNVMQTAEDGTLTFGEPLLASPPTRSWCCRSRSGTTSCRSPSASEPPRPASPSRVRRAAAWCCARRFFDSMRRSLRGAGRAGFLADLGLDQRGADQVREPLERRAAILLLAAFAARG